MQVALVHDYLTQRGGAERVVLSLVRAFPGAPLSTRRSTTRTGRSPSSPTSTCARCRSTGSRRSGATTDSRSRSSRRRSRGSRSRPTSSSAARAAGRTERTSRARRSSTATPPPAGSTSRTATCAAARRAVHLAAARCSEPLRRWDRARRSLGRPLPRQLDRGREPIRDIYGIDAEVVPPPPALTPEGPADGRRHRAGVRPVCVAAPSLQERRCRRPRLRRSAGRAARDRRRRPRGAGSARARRPERHGSPGASPTPSFAGSTPTAVRSSPPRTRTSA